MQHNLTLSEERVALISLTRVSVHMDPCTVLSICTYRSLYSLEDPSEIG